jgi:HJR/Mrr/RecB family endonuclease
MTFDVKLDSLLAYKRQLAQDMLNGSGDITPGDFSLPDVVPGEQVNHIDERVTLDIALRMNWQMFECLVAALWAKQGGECYRTPGTKDYGVDVVAIRGQLGQLIQVKSTSIDGFRFGWDAVKEVVAGEAFYQNRHPKIKFKKLCITNQYFNNHASENAELNVVELLDQSDLAKTLEDDVVTLLEVERMLHTAWH